MKSPLKFFFSTAIFLLALGAICNSMWRSLANHIVSPNNSLVMLSRPYNLALADYHLSIGEIEMAMNEYKAIADNDQPPVQTIAKSRLSQIFLRQQSLRGRLSYIATQILWKAYPRLYGLGGLLILCWAILLLSRWIRKRPSFAILPIKNCTDLSGADKISTLVIEHMQDVQWKTKNASGTINKLIAEQLEIPTIGLTNEGQNIDIDKLIENAWAVTSGNSNLSLTELMKSLRLWLNTPQHIITGSLLESHETIQLRLFMYQGNAGKLEKTWQIHVPITQKSSMVSILVEDITFLLLHFFNQNVATQNWRALQASLNGILYFELYFADRQTTWLDAAQRSLESALTIDPDYIVARYNLGLVFMTMGQFDSARMLLKPITLK